MGKINWTVIDLMIVSCVVGFILGLATGIWIIGG